MKDANVYVGKLHGLLMFPYCLSLRGSEVRALGFYGVYEG